MADYFSRVEINATFYEIADVDYPKFSLKQAEVEFLRLSGSSMQLITKTLPEYGVSITGDISTGQFRPLVPESF